MNVYKQKQKVNKLIQTTWHRIQATGRKRPLIGQKIQPRKRKCARQQLIGLTRQYANRARIVINLTTRVTFKPEQTNYTKNKAGPSPKTFQKPPMIHIITPKKGQINQKTPRQLTIK